MIVVATRTPSWLISTCLCKWPTGWANRCPGRSLSHLPKNVEACGLCELPIIESEKIRYVFFSVALPTPRLVEVETEGVSRRHLMSTMAVANDTIINCQKQKVEKWLDSPLQSGILLLLLVCVRQEKRGRSPSSQPGCHLQIT